ncbi:hypothetical protein Mithridates_00006 [Acinetobacter phage Mithridates]|nr:hypothetical protein Mithridates_00006 [Acinetobacter phage Mithridates]
MKRSALHLGVNKHGVVKWVKVTAFRDTSYSLAWKQCQIQGMEVMQSFECYIPTRQTKPFKKLLDSVYNQELVLAVINEVRGS